MVLKLRYSVISQVIAIIVGIGLIIVVLPDDNTQTKDEVVDVEPAKEDTRNLNAARNDDRKYAISGKDLEAPVADAGPDQIVALFMVVTLNGSGSTDDVGIDNYTWTFNDNGFRELYGMDPTYMFSMGGEFPVILNVTDAVGNWDTDTMAVMVDCMPPVVTERVDKYYIDPQTDYFYVGNDTTINLTATDDYSGVKQIYYELDCDTFNYTVNISTADLSEGAHSFKIKAEDNLGNWGYSNFKVLTSKVFIVDETSPTVTADFTGDHHVMSGSGNLHVQQNTGFVLSAEDVKGTLPQSGVGEIWYSLDGKLVWETHGKFDELMEGEHTFIYGAVDNIGNNGTTMEYTVLINESLPLPPILRPATNRTRYENLLMVGWVPQDSTAWIMVNHNRTYNVTPDPEDGGNFSLYVIVDPGENIITGYTVDYFGRHSLSTNPFTVLLDREPPSTTGMNPERNSTNVPVISNIAIYFNEPLSELVIVLKYYNESNETWEIWNGEYDYVPWSLRATYIPGKPLYYETRYRISIEMLDVARNFAAHDFYSRSDHDSYSFITGDTEHVYQEFNCVIKSQKIDITYNKLGERLLRQNIWKPLAFEPLPPPKDHISLGIYFNITFDSSVTWFSLTLWDYTVSVLQDAALRNPERWDFDNLSFYRLSTDWEKLNTITVSGTEIRYFMADPGSDIITMGVFAPDLDWDGDGYLNGIDEFPRDQEEHADSDGDGIGDRSDPYPYDPHDQSLEYDTMIGPVRNANGDPIEGANVTFDHEGVQYFSITDSRGFATIRGFPLPQIPRGTIITVTHDGETVEGQYGEPLVFDTAEEEKSSGSRNIILLIVGIIVIVSILMIYIFFAVREDEEYSEDIEADYTNENRVGQYLEPER